MVKGLSMRRGRQKPRLHVQLLPKMPGGALLTQELTRCRHFSTVICHAGSVVLSTKWPWQSSGQCQPQKCQPPPPREPNGHPTAKGPKGLLTHQLKSQSLSSVLNNCAPTTEIQLHFLPQGQLSPEYECEKKKIKHFLTLTRAEIRANLSSDTI